MPRLRVAILLFACGVAASAVVAACSGFSSEETAPTSDADAETFDAKLEDADLGNDASSASDAGDSEVPDSAAPTPFCATQDASAFCYDFEDGVLPLDGWSIEGLSPTGTQISQRRIQVLSEQSVSTPNALKVAATSGTVLATDKIFMNHVFDKPASRLSVTARMRISNLCNAPVGSFPACPGSATIARVTMTSGRRLYWLLMLDGKLGVQGDQATAVYGTKASKPDTWETAELTVSSGGAMTVAIGSATVALAALSADADVDRVASLSIGIQSSEFSGGNGWVYYLDNLQLTTTP